MMSGRTVTVLKHKARLERRARDQRHQLRRAVVQVNAIQAAGVEVANGDGDAGAHDDGVIGDVRQISLTAETVGCIGSRSIRREVELEVVVGVAKRPDEAEAFGGRVGLMVYCQRGRNGRLRGLYSHQLDLIELVLGVGRVRSREWRDGRWVGQGAIVGVLGLVLAGGQLLTSGSGGDEAERSQQQGESSNHRDV